MALFYFLVVSLCIACCKVTASDSIVLQVDNDFECVDIYKQPSLQHPLLKNHKIQLYPTFAKNVVRSRTSYDHEYLRHYAQRSNSEVHTVTIDTTQNKIFYGGSALISGYNLSLNVDQYSTSSVIIESGPPTELNSIHAGLEVRPDIYRDSQLRLTALWTAFGSAHSGCSDTQCPGFIQVTQDKGYFLGSVQSPATRIGEPSKKFLGFKIQRDRSTGNWWLIVDVKDEIHVGYWPKEIFTHLSSGASKVRFGGETFGASSTWSPPMGSGRLPRDGFQYSALIGLLQHIDTNYDKIDVIPEYMKVYNDAKKECYDLKFYEELGKLYRRAILYGGPGGQCNL
ncbi:hypothetical protein P8452_56298 [Trifolium repens]|nr:hypothetical protein P8452_56298 [Trifolium repens]